MQAAIKICKLVDGLPLGIELAASWARDFTFEQIAEEVQRNLEFLQSSFQDLSDRHRSLQASFEHSWDLLSESEREVFSKLAVFQGDFSAAAAQFVAGAALPWLMQLEDKSLVRRAAFGRYELHPLIRQYASQKLRQYSRKVEDQTQRQHAQYFCAFLKEHEPGLKGGRQAEALNEIDTDIENVRAAWDWAAAHHSLDLLDQAGVGMMLFLESRSRWREGEARFTEAIDQLQNNYPAGNSNKKTLAFLLAAQGWFSCRLTRFPQAETSLLRALHLSEDGEPTFSRAFTHFAIGFLYTWMSRFPEALLHLTTCLSSTERVEGGWGKAWACEMLAEIAFESGQTGLREEPFQNALALFEQLGEQRGCGRALNYLGSIYLAQGRFLEARDCFERLLKKVEKLGDVWGAAGGYSKLGWLAVSSGSNEQAWRLYQHSLALFEKTGDQRRAALTMRELGEVAAALGKQAEMEDYFHRALEIAKRARTIQLAQEILLGITVVLLQKTDAADAEHPAPDEQAASHLKTALANMQGDQLTALRTHQIIAHLHTRFPANPFEADGKPEPEQALWEAVDFFLQWVLPG